MKMAVTEIWGMCSKWVCWDDGISLYQPQYSVVTGSVASVEASKLSTELLESQYPAEIFAYVCIILLVCCVSLIATATHYLLLQ